MKEKKKTKKKKIRRLLLVLITVILVIILLLQCTKKEEKAVNSYEKNVNAITEIDYSKRQKALNAIVEEGNMNVNYSAKAVFNGTVSESFNVKNIQNNHDAIVFKIYDENDTCVYTSKKIEPGYEINSIELVRELRKGNHECKLKIGYAQEGNVSSVFPIKIEVK